MTLLKDIVMEEMKTKMGYHLCEKKKDVSLDKKEGIRL
jgi:hypothetical protein